MKLEKIKIENYKSIDNLEFEISEVNNSYTYSLLGINESGKSSFLKAISLIDNDDINYPQDFFSDSKPVKITLLYSLTDGNLTELKKELTTKYKFSKELLDKTIINSIQISIEFQPTTTKAKTIEQAITFETEVFSDYTLKEKIPTKKGKEENELEDFNLSTFFEQELDDYF